MDLPLHSFHHLITREDLVRYAGASGDFQPIHYDDAIAQAHGLPGVIAHGMLTMGLLSRVIEPFYVNGWVLVDWHARFRSMLRPGDTIYVCGAIKTEESHALVIDLSATRDQEKKPAVSGRAHLSR